jgi:Uma2 family endonuclease
MPGDATFCNDPVVVVEIVSPSSRFLDTGRKVQEYFALRSVAHYLVVRLDDHIVHHHRRAGAEVVTAFAREGVLRLDPPGLTLRVADLLPPE